jgi:hypothetical protein
MRTNYGAAVDELCAGHLHPDNRIPGPVNETVAEAECRVSGLCDHVPCDWNRSFGEAALRLSGSGGHRTGMRAE